MSSAEAGSRNHDVPVLIVGGGPIGLGLAADLGARGVRCLLVEQSDRSIDDPRANTVNSRTMEFCRRWGVAEAVRNSGAPADFPSDIVYVTGLQGYTIAYIARPAYGGDTPLPTTPERSQRCNQLFFDPILRRLAESFPSVTLRHKCRFERFEHTDDGVLAHVRDLVTGREEPVRARFLVACCGGGSSIPETLGIGYEGRQVVSYNLNLFLRIPELWTYHDKGKTAFYFFVGAECGANSLIELDGKELWRLGVTSQSGRLDPAKVHIAGIIETVIGPDVPYELISARPWVCRSIVADRWKERNVLLAGDAVHKHSPAGGFGMNTGMGDAVDLGWKLAAVIEGWGGPHLLDSYQAERWPVAKRNVREATENAEQTYATVPAAVREDTEEGERLRRALGEEILREKTKQFVSHGIALGYRYDDSPIVWPDGSPPPRDSVSDYVQTSRPGSRAPHAWLGEGRSTIDLFGRGFVLLGFRGGDADALIAAARARGVPLEHVAIADEAIAELYERRLVLVRPDGHVAWRGDDPPADPLAVIDVVRGAARRG